MVESENVGVIRKLLNAFGAKDIETMIGLLDANVLWQMPGPKQIPYAGNRAGRDQVADFYRILLDTCEFEYWQLKELIDGGDIVVAIGFERVRVRSTGKVFEQHLAIAYKLRAGKVTEAQFFEDTAAEASAFS